MGFNLANIFGKTAGEIVEKVGNIADEFITTKAEKEEFKLRAEQMAQEAIKASSEAAQKELDSYLQDAQSARNREIQLNTSDSASWLSKNTLGMLALFITIGFFGLMGYMMKFDIPTANKDILNIMLGSLGSAWIGVVSYYFGSSAGAQRNGEALRQIAKK